MLRLDLLVSLLRLDLCLDLRLDLRLDPLLQKFGDLCSSSVNLKCKLPNHDLDLLVSLLLPPHAVMQLPAALWLDIPSPLENQNTNAMKEGVLAICTLCLNGVIPILTSIGKKKKRKKQHITLANIDIL
ncbi:hypothetical protein Adt_26564 [Abeliophyllum distichum]|uniref:Uncharacterized protein n=1 Tax=Abeliophyllum distichum TaxID=126358 RepID=A0ABD1RRY5_9LAMI